jgi:hypothetical protein
MTDLSRTAVRTIGQGDVTCAKARFRRPLIFGVFQHRVVGGSSSTEADRIGNGLEEETVQMDYFAGLDISMNETHALGMDR